MKHGSHPSVMKRLKRAEGHLRAIVTMLEDERPCMDIAQQLHAVEAAVANAKRALIHDHIEHCLEDSSVQGDKNSATALHELKALAKYL